MAWISYKRPDSQVEVVDFDVLEQAGVTHTAKATQFPVETGAVTSDHVLQDSDVVQFSGLVTNTPLPSNVRLRDRVNSEYQSFQRAAEAGQFAGRAERAYRALLAAKEAGALVEIATPLQTYADMVIESLGVTESADQGEALTFQIAARRIRTTSTETVPVPIEPALPVADQGRQTTKPADEYDTEGTVAWNLKQKAMKAANSAR